MYYSCEFYKTVIGRFIGVLHYTGIARFFNSIKIYLVMLSINGIDCVTNFYTVEKTTFFMNSFFGIVIENDKDY